MELLWQFLVILLISLIGELLHFLIPLPIPASIYGLVLMLVALCTNLVKVRQVRKVSGFLLDIMSIMFVPPAVGLIVRWADIRQLLFPVVLAATLGTVLTMAAAGLVTQALIRRKEK